MKFKQSLTHLLAITLILFIAGGVFASNNVDQERLKALSEAVGAIGKPAIKPKPAVTKPKTAAAKPKTTQKTTKPAVTPPKPAIANVCWTPDGTFSPVGVTSTVPYGPRGLAAQYVYGTVKADRSVKAVWKYNKSAQALSIGECKMVPDAKSVTNGFVKSESPLLPGIYEVSFIENSKTLASGKITITAPMDRGARSIEDIYAEALKSMNTAFTELDASRAQTTAKAAENALPLLGAVINAHPTKYDVQALYELAQMMIAVGKMDSLASGNVPDKVLDWGMRSFSHATIAANLATDESLKAKARQYADTLEKALPKMSEAAAKKVK